MSTPAIERLREIKTLPQLVAYLRDELDWPISSNNTEDITFDYEASELGLDKETAVKIKEIKQLRPLTGNQPWGIFFVNFEKKRLPVMVMRRILRSLVFKKRTSPAKSDRQAWHASDLLFISAYGEEHDRAITFAHFVEDEELGGLAELRVLGWDDDDTPLKYDYVAHTLHDKFRWRGPFERDPDMWRKTWRDAFELRHREVITTSKQLALSLAALAKKIRSRVRSILRYEDGFGQIRKLQTAFRKALIHDLSDDDFADMYAQTITYGLFSARVSRPAGIRGENIIDMVPVTNPFLRDMLETFLNLSGRKGKIDFDELGIQEVTALLNDTNVEAILRDFGKLARREDPVIHFYEDFLREYDAEKRIKRGVFYTPRPVVSYIVRSVHELLQSEFKLAHGLADTTTWGEMVRKTPGLKLPSISGDPDRYQPINESEPFVQILDPAVGTATFLVEVIDIIYRHLKTKWDCGGFKEMPELPATSFPRQPADFSEYWNQYVAFSLLPRLHGFELMMAPYAIAHMKIGLKLWETGYRFAAEERAHIYLTNSLEEPTDIQRDLPALSPALAHEAEAVNAVKRNKRFTIVIGNPPYSASISEPEWLMRLLDDWKQGLNETKIDLNREEWKFLRLAQYLCSQASTGTVGFIINRDFLDGIAKRRMREHLGQSFPLRTVVDLNGDVKGNIADENVFEIEQGVAIAVMRTANDTATLRFASRVGTRAEKYADLLAKQPIDAALIKVEPSSPYFRWVPYLSEHTAAAAAEYDGWVPIKSAFATASSGIQTKRDALCIAFTRDEMWSNVERFNTLSISQARDEFDLGPDGRDWTVAAAKADIKASGPNQRHLCAILYRPFDRRFTYWTGRTKGFVAYPRRDVMQHLIGRRNIGMIFNRQIVGDSVSHFGVARIPICHGTFYLGNKGQDYFAPLFRFDDDLSKGDKPGDSNLTVAFVNAAYQKLAQKPEKIAPEELFNYCYAVFHSPTYRSRYAEFLKIDFPRLPLTGNLELFSALAKFGGELVAFHLLESPKLDKPRTEFIGGRNPEVEKVTYAKNTVWIDRAQTTGFKGVPEAVWNFHIGGYRVCEKWLKDRKGRTLSKDDIAHYHKIVIALSETIRLMSEIDKVIEKHGGWPEAFQTKETSTV